MAEKMKLLEQFEDTQGFHTAIFLTYGADFAFFEQTVLREVWKSDCRNVLVFIDAKRYADTIKQLGSTVALIGRRYIVVPVDLGAYRSFHPKLALLLGHRCGRVFIGSGNLTFTGYAYNHETFTRLEWSPENPDLHPIFRDVWSMISEINRLWGHSSTADLILNKAKQVADWIAMLPESTPPVQFFHSLSEPLITQYARALRGWNFTRITVVTPFLDNAAKALEELWAAFQPADLDLVLQPGWSVGDVEGLERLRVLGAPLSLRQFNDTARYMHAKLYLFKTTDRAFVLVGSANCTQTALLASALEGGNVETALLQSGQPADYYDDLLSGLTTPILLDTLSELKLRPHSRSERTGTASPVHLLDVTVRQGTLHVTYELDHNLQDGQSLWLHFGLGSTSALPPAAPLGQGKHTIHSPLDEPMRNLFRRVTSVSIWIQNHDEGKSDVPSNSVWVINEDVWRYQIGQHRVASIAAAERLGVMDPGDADGWQDLYEALVELVELDVEGLEKRGGTYTASPRERSPLRSGSGNEGETKIILVDTGSVEQSHSDVSEELYRESILFSWLEYVRGRLPGRDSDDESQENGDAENVAPIPLRLTKRSLAADRNPDLLTERRFVNLVRRYIKSLHNTHYMDLVSLYHILDYYAIFQRITRLLLDCGKSFGPEDYVGLALDINEGFFGPLSRDPPAIHPQRSHYIQRVWEDEWISHDVAGHALASSVLTLQFATKIANVQLMERAKLQTVQVLCAVVGIVGVDWLDQAPNWLRQIDRVYNLGQGSVVEAMLTLLSQSLGVIDSVLEIWARRASIQAGKTEDPRRELLLLRARIDYARARYDIAALSTDSEVQRRLCANLVFWLRAIGDWESAREWSDTYVALLALGEDPSDITKELISQGRSSLFARDYEEAEFKLREAVLLAQQSGNEKLKQQAESLLQSVVSLFLGR